MIWVSGSGVRLIICFAANSVFLFVLNLIQNVLLLAILLIGTPVCVVAIVVDWIEVGLARCIFVLGCSVTDLTRVVLDDVLVHHFFSDLIVLIP